MQDPPADERNSAEPTELIEPSELARQVVPVDADPLPNPIASLDPLTRHRLLNEFHALQTGLYLLNAAFRSQNEEVFDRTMDQLGKTLERLTQSSKDPENRSVPQSAASKSDPV